MEFTKEQEKKLKTMLENNENETIYMCIKCGERLRGMMNVRFHYEEHKHYEYKCPGSEMRLMFA